MGTVPVRTCVGCRARSPQADLIRVARGSDGLAHVDDASARGHPRGRAEGRGAYLCPRRSCIVRARRSGSLKRALGAQMVTPDGLIDELLRRFPEEEGHG
jgi:predicted RNA-binding protein YlxR (DUF448 family)